MIESIEEIYGGIDSDEPGSESYEETQMFLQSLIDESYAAQSQQTQATNRQKIKKVDYKRLMFQLLSELTEEETQRLF